MYYGLEALFDFQSRATFIWPTLFFLTFTTLVIYYYLLKTRAEQFVQLYLLTLVIKIVAYAGYCLAIAVKDRDNAGGNVIFFLVTYFIFTALEVTFLYRQTSR